MQTKLIMQVPFSSPAPGWRWLSVCPAASAVFSYTRRCSRLYLYILILCLPAVFPSIASAQHVGVKTNLLYDASTTANLGLEIGLAPRWTLDISANYNPWTFSENKKFKHLLLQPEARYWFCERFNGHFVGLHLLGGPFNAGGIPLGNLKDYRFQGWLAGAGIAYGYQWMLSKHWNLEASLGVGYVQARYDKYECARCGKKLQTGRKEGFVTPTRFAVSIIYLIK